MTVSSRDQAPFIRRAHSSNARVYGRKAAATQSRTADATRARPVSPDAVDSSPVSSDTEEEDLIQAQDSAVSLSKGSGGKNPTEPIQQLHVTTARVATPHAHIHSSNKSPQRGASTYSATTTLSSPLSSLQSHSMGNSPKLRSTRLTPSPEKLDSMTSRAAKRRSTGLPLDKIPTQDSQSTSAHSMNAADELQLIEQVSPPRRKRNRTNPFIATNLSMNDSVVAPTAPAAPTVRATVPDATNSRPSSPSKRLSRASTPLSSINSPKSAPSSPAKDLSSVFDAFAEKMNSPQPENSSQPVHNDEKKVRPGLTRSGSSLVASMNKKSPQKNSSSGSDLFGTSPTRALQRSNSFPGNLSPTRPSSPTKPSIPHPLSRSNTLNPNELVTMAPRPIVAGKKTYGGNRKFKADLVDETILLGAGKSQSTQLNLDDDLNAPLTASTSTLQPATSKISSLFSNFGAAPSERKSYSAMREFIGADEEEEMGDESQESINVRSAIQLRVKGENNRFADQLNYLVDGLQRGQPLGVRRSSTLDVLRKMLDKEFVKKLKASGLVENVYKDFRISEAGQGDRVLDPALSFLVYKICQDQRMLEPILRITARDLTKDQPSMLRDSLDSPMQDLDEPVCDVVATLARMLSLEWAGEELGAKMGARGISKSDALSMNSVRDIIKKEFDSTENSVRITLRSLCIETISMIASFEPRPIFRPQYLIARCGALEAVLQTLFSETKNLDSRLKRYENALDFLPEDGSFDFSTILKCLQIIEACLNSEAVDFAMQLIVRKITQFAPTVVQLVTASRICIISNETDSNHFFEILAKTLKFIIELSNHNSACSQGFSQIPHIFDSLLATLGWTLSALGTPREDSEPDKISYQDVLGLALGALASLVETEESVKDTVRETSLDPKCEYARNCVFKCSCSNKISGVEWLAKFYLNPLNDLTESLNRDLISGYSSILIGLLLVDSEENQKIVSKQLEFHPNAKQNLVQAMTDFAELHQQRDGAHEEQHQTQETQNEDEEILLDQRVEENPMAQKIHQMLKDFK